MSNFDLEPTTPAERLPDLHHRMPRPLGFWPPAPTWRPVLAVCWQLRDGWAGLPPGIYVRDGRSTWLVPGTQHG